MSVKIIFCYEKFVKHEEDLAVNNMRVRGFSIVHKSYKINVVKLVQAQLNWRSQDFTEALQKGALNLTTIWSQYGSGSVVLFLFTFTCIT